jgi:hypothetical protein
MTLGRKEQLFCFSYHKSGTTLLLHVMTRVCERLGLKLANHYGLVDQSDPTADIVLLPHSLLAQPLERPYRAIRMVRDPRDIWVSGYLYHLRCDEEWCTNADFDESQPIQWPRIDHSVAHRPEEWKRDFFRRLNGKTYQQNLLDRPREDGLQFELDGYTGWTMDAMRHWPRMKIDSLDLRLEDAMSDFDTCMLRIFKHFGFSKNQCAAALSVAKHEDVRRMDEAEMARRPQISSRSISKWREFLDQDQIISFESSYGDLIATLGYDTDATIDRFVSSVSHEPSIRLWSNGLAIDPVARNGGSYRFILSPEVYCVTIATTDGRCGGTAPLAVRDIVFESGHDRIVLPADHPCFLDGWRDPQRLPCNGSTILYREALGTAVIRCPSLSRPSLMTIRFVTLPA